MDENPSERTLDEPDDAKAAYRLGTLISKHVGNMMTTRTIEAKTADTEAQRQSVLDEGQKARNRAESEGGGVAALCFNPRPRAGGDGLKFGNDRG